MPMPVSLDCDLLELQIVLTNPSDCNSYGTAESVFSCICQQNDHNLQEPVSVAQQVALLLCKVDLNAKDQILLLDLLLEERLNLSYSSHHVKFSHLYTQSV